MTASHGEGSSSLKAMQTSPVQALSQDGRHQASWDGKWHGEHTDGATWAWWGPLQLGAEPAVLPIASRRSQSHHSKDLDALPIPFCKGPRTTCLSSGTNLHSTSCDNPMTWPSKPLSSKMSMILRYQRCRSSSTQQERWPRHPFMSMDHGQH